MNDTHASRSRLCSALVGIAFASALLAPAREARACGACGCALTPSGTSVLGLVGTDTPDRGTVRVSLDGRAGFHWDRTHDTVDETSFEARGTFGVAWTPWSWLTLQALVPVVYRNVSSANYGVNTFGLGDGEALARVRVWQSPDGDVRHAVFVTGGLKVPTAPAFYDADGYSLAIASQLGTGSWDPVAGASYVVSTRTWSFFATMLAQWATTGRDGWTAGSSVTATLAPQYRFAPAVSALLGVDLRASGPDHLSDRPVPNSGGALIAVSPTLLVNPTPDLLLRLTVQVPVVNATLGHQSDSPAVLLGATYTFGRTPAPRPSPQPATWAGATRAPATPALF